MGNGQSLESFPPSHVRIYRDLLRIQSPATRAEMIRTLLAGPEYVTSAKKGGVYAHMLSYVGRVSSGERPAALPGEGAVAALAGGAGGDMARGGPIVPQHMVPYGAASQVRPQIQQRPQQQVLKARRNEKALGYFQACLQVLGLEEEVALTEDALKKAYKRAAVKAHPDKGGTEEDFEAITRAYAFLGETLRRISGGKKGAGAGAGLSGSPAGLPLQDTETRRAPVMIKQESVEPIRLNPKKLDMNLFNKIFEEHHVPDPDNEGYGDWLRAGDGEEAAPSGPKFVGKFNRDVFNKAFEDETKSRGHRGAVEPEALNMFSGGAVEIGRGKADTFTAAANANLKFTDLRSAYTSENTITDKVADVNPEARNFTTYSAQYKEGPKPLTAAEARAIQLAEQTAAERERLRQERADRELKASDTFLERMKRRIMVDGNPVE